VAAAKTRYEIVRPRVVDEVIDDEVVVINLESGVYYGFRGTAAAVWAGIAAHATAAEIAAAIDGRGPGSPADLGGIVDRFVAELVTEGLVTATAAATADDWDVGELASIDAPVLEKFTDLEDLLILDPIHDVDAEGWPHTAPT
jgi:hypothetical protein